MSVDSSPTKGASEEETTATTTTKHYLERPIGMGMNPKSILTEMYGEKGKRMRHEVHDGALRLPAASLEMMEGMLHKTADWRSTKETVRDLPGLDEVKRPSLDDTLGTIQVVELGLALNPQPQMPLSLDPNLPLPPAVPKWRTVARRRNLKPGSSSIATTTTTTTTATTPSLDEAQRIRGGGDEVETTAPKEATPPVPAASSSSSTVPPPAPAGLASAFAPPAPSSSTMPSSLTPVANAFDPPTSSSLANASAPPAPSTTSTPAAANAFLPPSAANPSLEPPSSTTASDFEPPPSTSPTTKAPPPANPLAAPPAGQPPTATTTATTSATVSNPLSGAAPEKSAPMPPAAPAAAPTLVVSTGTSLPTKVEAPVQSSAPAAPAAVASSTTTAKAPAVAPARAVQPLAGRPAAQWEQGVPGSNDEMPSDPKTPTPSWYSSDKVSDLERRLLPEWFDQSAPHRTPDSYIKAREHCIKIADQLKNRYLTSTVVRRTLAGDAGSLSRLHRFLVSYSFINEDATNDSAPTPSVLREEPGVGRKQAAVWNDKYRDELMEAVVEESSSKRRKLKGDGASIDWTAVAGRMGNGASSTECERVFLSTPWTGTAAAPPAERSITPELPAADNNKEDELGFALKGKMLKELVDEAHPDVIAAATNAALQATEDLVVAQKAAVLAVASSKAVEKAMQEEETVGRLLAELHEQRMQKLENRLALLDDVEGILEAERVALELERRDLYTARCRHWFGGGN